MWSRLAASKRAASDSFAEVEDAAAAEALAGCHCLVRESDVEHLSAVSESGLGNDGVEGLVRYLAAQPGAASDEVRCLDERPWMVVDAQAGAIGALLRVEERPVQSLLVVARADGTEALIPFVDEFVADVDEAGRTIAVSLPSGLLDL